jgi:hypothetical protein
MQGGFFQFEKRVGTRTAGSLEKQELANTSS